MHTITTFLTAHWEKLVAVTSLLIALSADARSRKNQVQLAFLRQLFLERKDIEQLIWENLRNHIKRIGNNAV